MPTVPPLLPIGTTELIYWGGGARIIADARIFPTSYREGARNPDETRSGSF